MGKPRERMGKLVSRWVRVDGRRLHTRVSVDTVPVGRPAIVLVHGLLVSSRYMVPAGRRLAPYYRVHAPDLPGYGKSAKLPEALDVSGMADALAAYIEAARLERVVLVANSFGCQIAVDYAVCYPARLERLVLAGPTVDPQQRTVFQVVGGWLALKVPREPFGLYLIVLRDFLDMGPRRLLTTFGYMMADCIEEKLPQVRVPTLVIWGEHDPLVPPRWGEEAVRLLPLGLPFMLRGAPHTVNYNAARRFVRVVRAFLAGEPAGPGVDPGPV